MRILNADVCFLKKPFSRLCSMHGGGIESVCVAVHCFDEDIFNGSQIIMQSIYRRQHEAADFKQGSYLEELRPSFHETVFFFRPKSTV